MKRKYQPQEIEKITGINRKQIYEYDLLGIVKPIEIDEKNGYKYYDEEAIKKFGLISLLVKLGETPRTLQKKFNEKNFKADKEIEKIIETAEKQINELNKIIETAEGLKTIKELETSIKNKKNHTINMDSVISKVAVLGIPSLILMISISATGLAGAAALTVPFGALGPFGGLGGIAILGIAGLVSEAIKKYGFDAMFEGVVKELYKRGESKQSIKEKISKYPISKELKLKLLDSLDKTK